MLSNGSLSSSHSSSAPRLPRLETIHGCWDLALSPPACVPETLSHGDRNLHTTRAPSAQQEGDRQPLSPMTKPHSLLRAKTRGVPVTYRVFSLSSQNGEPQPKSQVIAGGKEAPANMKRASSDALLTTCLGCAHLL